MMWPTPAILQVFCTSHEDADFGEFTYQFPHACGNIDVWICKVASEAVERHTVLQGLPVEQLRAEPQAAQHEEDALYRESGERGAGIHGGAGLRWGDEISARNLLFWERCSSIRRTRLRERKRVLMIFGWSGRLWRWQAGSAANDYLVG